jgi:DNA (cytosine-5)-methyltransferase 1
VPTAVRLAARVVRYLLKHGGRNLTRAVNGNADQQNFALDYVEIDDSNDDDLVELPPPARNVPKYVRNPPLIPPLEETLAVDYNGIRIRCGTDLELTNGDFLKVRAIFKNGDGTYVRGLYFRRSKFLPVPDRHTNELTLVAEECKDDQRPLFVQGQVEYPLTDVLRKRRIIMTRDPYPRRSFRELYTTIEGVKTDEERLVCRYVYSPIYETAYNPKAKRRPKAVEGMIRRITERESAEYDIDAGADRRIEKMKHWMRTLELTYVSGCCGAGGDLTGAKMAGLRPVIGFDHWVTAIRTCAANHDDVDLYVRDQAETIDTNPDSWMAIKRPKRLAVLHCSFPCVYFSPAHTVQGKDDDKNSALILATGSHLRYWRPLVHTQEQTSGILSHHPDYFFTIVSDIVKECYNVRWKVCRFEEYGLPALRKRVIIFAAR